MACNGVCLTGSIGYDEVRNVFTYTVLVCPGGTADTREYPPPLKGTAPSFPTPTCANCPSESCVQEFKERPSTGHHAAGLPRRAFRKGVPCPHNPNHVPDEFLPSDPWHLLNEYTAHYCFDGKERWVRLFVLKSSKPGAISLLQRGWELDPSSDPSPFYIRHLRPEEVSVLSASPGSHTIRIEPYGTFIVAVYEGGHCEDYAAEMAPAAAEQATPAK